MKYIIIYNKFRAKYFTGQETTEYNTWPYLLWLSRLKDAVVLPSSFNSSVVVLVSNSPFFTKKPPMSHTPPRGETQAVCPWRGCPRVCVCCQVPPENLTHEMAWELLFPPPHVMGPVCECSHLSTGRSGNAQSLVPLINNNSTEVRPFLNLFSGPLPPVTITTETYSNEDQAR